MWWYFIVYGVFAIWVFTDAKKRMNHVVGWPLATFILGPVALSTYFAKRNLKEGEVREGGTGWNVLKNLALFWTITMVIAGMVGMIGAGEAIDTAPSEAAEVGTAIGATIGLGLIFALWLIVLVGALVLGLFLKKSSIVEKGPTGPLAQAASGLEKHDE